jgi:hypothetical protein
MHAASEEVANDMLVMDDLVEHVEWRAMFLKRPLDGCQSHFHPCAKTPGLRKNNLLDCHDYLNLDDSSIAVNTLY